MIKDKFGLILRLIALLLMAFFISSRMMTESLAKYSTTATSQDSARVAKFIDIDKDITSEGTIIFNSELVMNPGDEKEVELTIVNSGEVTLDFTMDISSYETLPLDYYIDGVLIKNYQKRLNPGDSVKVTVLMKWEEELNDYIYSNVVDSVSFYASCEQVD